MFTDACLEYQSPDRSKSEDEKTTFLGIIKLKFLNRIVKIDKVIYFRGKRIQIYFLKYYWTSHLIKYSLSNVNINGVDRFHWILLLKFKFHRCKQEGNCLPCFYGDDIQTQYMFKHDTGRLIISLNHLLCRGFKKLVIKSSRCMFFDNVQVMRLSAIYSTSILQLKNYPVIITCDMQKNVFE